MGHRHTGLVVLMAFLAALTLSACAGLPTESAVQEGLPVGPRPAPPVRVVPLGPGADATPEQIVRGFLRAGAARDYFVRATRQRWRPSDGVTVYSAESGLSVAALDGDRLGVSADVVAQIDADGRYRQVRPGTRKRVSFELRREGGQWRIAASPPAFGLWLSAADVDRLYSPFRISFVSRPPGRYLVSEVRWFPVTSGLATTLARAQLGAVPAYLAGAVTTGVPAGTQLDPDAVPVVAGTAQLNLSAGALAATSDQRKAMAAQFLTTLQQVPAVVDIELSVGGTPMDGAGQRGVVSALDQVGYSLANAPAVTSVVVRNGTQLEREDPVTLSSRDSPRRNTPVAGPVLPKTPLGWTSLALSRSSDEVAGIGGDRAQLTRWRGGSSWRLAPFATDLTRPSYDGANGLWVAGRNAGRAAVWVIDTTPDLQKAQPRAVSATWLTGRSVVALRVARDNVRVAVITTDDDGGDLQVGISGIVRGDDGAPRALDVPLRVGDPLSAATDLTWVDETTLAVVGRADAAESLRPYVVRIGGAASPLSAVKGARSVLTTGGERGILVLTDSGRAYRRIGNGWQELARALDVLAPGG